MKRVQAMPKGKFEIGILTVTFGVSDILEALADGNNADFVRRLGQPTQYVEGVKHVYRPTDWVGEDVQALIDRHTAGDWGNLDDHDRQENENGIMFEDNPIDPDDVDQYDRRQRLLSAYEITDKDGDKRKVWVITEWDRSETTVLLPSEY